MRKEKIDFMKGISFVILAISFLWITGIAAERKKPIALKELQDPKGPFYVPCPYPKTRNEIIEDLKYAIKLCHGPAMNFRDGRFVGLSSDTDTKPLGLFAPNSDFKVAEIEKVKNRTIDFPDEFSYLIIVRDKKENAVAYLALSGHGSYLGGVTPFKRFSKPLKSKAEALNYFSAYTDTSKVKKMERIFTASKLALYPFAPAWEFVAQDNSKYYLDVNYNIYKLQREKNGKQDKIKTTEDEMIVYDSLNEKTLFLKKIN